MARNEKIQIFLLRIKQGIDNLHGGTRGWPIKGPLKANLKGFSGKIFESSTEAC